MMLYKEENASKEVTTTINKQVSFDNEESLGKTVVEKKLICNLGCGDPIVNLESRLQFACGFDKLGFLCGFKFTAANPQNASKIFYVVFVPKLKSSIMRQQLRGMPSWYIWEWINSTNVNVLSRDLALKKYGFDIDLFFNSDYFKKAIPRFVQTVKNCLSGEVAQMLEDLDKAGEAINKYQRYIRAIEESFKTLESQNAGANFNLGNSSDGEHKVYRASKSYGLDHFQKRQKDEIAKGFKEWLASRKKADAEKQGNE